MCWNYSQKTEPGVGYSDHPRGKPLHRGYHSASFAVLQMPLNLQTILEMFEKTVVKDLLVLFYTLASVKAKFLSTMSPTPDPGEIEKQS